MKHESPDFYERLCKDGGQAGDFEKADEELKKRADILKNLFTNRGALGRFLSNPDTLQRLFGAFGSAKDIEQLKQCISEELKSPLDKAGVHIPDITAFPIYPYVALKLERNLTRCIILDWHVWVLVMIVTAIQACLYYCMHAAVIELLPGTIVVGFTIIGIQFAWTRQRAAHVVARDEKAEKEVVADGKMERFLMYIQQLNLFFLCFSAARLVFSSFFWTDYPILSLSMLILFICLYAVFVFIGSLTLPMFVIMLAVQRVTPLDIQDMKDVLKTHEKDLGTPVAAGKTSKGALQRGASTLTLV